MVAGIALVLGFLYALLVSNLLRKPASYAHPVAADIASGVLLAAEGYDWDKAKARLNDRPGCTGPRPAPSGWFRSAIRRSFGK